MIHPLILNNKRNVIKSSQSIGPLIRARYRAEAHIKGDCSSEIHRFLLGISARRLQEINQSPGKSKRNDWRTGTTRLNSSFGGRALIKYFGHLCVSPRSNAKVGGRIFAEKIGKIIYQTRSPYSNHFCPLMYFQTGLCLRLKSDACPRNTQH